MAKRLILGFAGEIASGKGAAAEYLAAHHGAVTFRFSTILRDLLTRLHLPVDRPTLERLSASLRKEFGEDVLAKAMSADAKAEKNPLIVIDGVRSLEDVRYLRALPEYKLVYITAPMRTRYDRLILRGENADDKKKKFEDFEDDHERETERAVKQLEAFAAEIIDNAGTLPELHAQLDAIVKKYGE